MSSVLPSISPYTYIIIASVIVIISFIFNHIANKTSVPSVLMLIGLGIIINYTLKYIGVPELNLLGGLEMLGIVGLIMIVLEAALDLELSKEKWPVLWKAFVSALVGIVSYVLIIAFVIQMFITSIDYLTALIYAIPISIMSSAIVIPSVNRLCKQKKEFMIYEATFADILGIMFFYFLIGNIEATSFGEIGASVILNILITISFSFISTYILLYIFQKFESDIKIFVFLAVLIALYAAGKMFHLSALLIILVFGLVLENRHIFIFKSIQKYFDHDSITEVFKDFKVLTIETAFIVRTFFFVIFGMTISLSSLLSFNVFAVSMVSLVIIYGLRFVFLKTLLKKDISPQLFIAPRGLISILLFFNIPSEFQIDDFESGIILFIIITTCLLMAVSMVRDSRGKNCNPIT